MIINQEDKPIFSVALKNRTSKTLHVNRKGTANFFQNFEIILSYIISSAIKIYTDHKYLTCKYSNTDIVLKLIFVLEEYSPEIEYIQGAKI